MEIYVLAVAAIAILCLWLRYVVRVVPVGKAAIKEQFGKFHSVASSGVYFILWPINSFKTIYWTSYGQDNQKVIVNTDVVTRNSTQMDIPPITCYTQQYINVKIDGTLMYTVTNLEKAVYETDDVLNLFYQNIQQATKTVISSKNVNELRTIPRDQLANEIYDTIIKDFNENDYGVRIDKMLIQEICIDNKLEEESRELAKQARQNKLLIDKERACALLEETKAENEHTRQQNELQRKNDIEFAKIEQQRKIAFEKAKFEGEKQKNKIELEREALEAELHQRIQKAETDAKERQLKVESERFTPEQFIELERIKGLHAIASNDSSVVYAPTADWIPQKILGLALEPNNKKIK